MRDSRQASADLLDLLVGHAASGKPLRRARECASADLLDLLEAVVDSSLETYDLTKLEWDPRPAVTVVLAAQGYPNSGSKGKLITGLEANETRLRNTIEQSLALATALTPEIGYERAAALAKTAYESSRTIRDRERQFFRPVSLA